MKITREQYQKLRHLCNKFGVQPSQIHLKKVLHVDERHLRRRVVIVTSFRSALRGHSQKSYLQFQAVKRIDLRRRLGRPKMARKRRSKSWRKACRTVRRQHQKKREETECANDLDDDTSDEGDGVKLEVHEVRDKLKTQLQLLQQGRRKSVGLAENAEDSLDKPPSLKVADSSLEQDENSMEEMPSLRISDSPERVHEQSEESLDDIEKQMLMLHDSPKKSIMKPIKSTEKRLSTKELEEELTLSTTMKLMKENPKDFLDSLLQKIKVEPEPTVSEKDEKPRKHKRKASVGVSYTEGTRYTSSPDQFLGFDDSEIPGMLPTPRVKNRAHSAFVDSKGAKDIKITPKKMTPTSSIDSTEHEGMVCAGSKPPTLAKPKRLTDVTKPRTVAEKRQLLSKRKGIKFLMMENEARIFSELAKIRKGKDEDYLLVSSNTEVNYQMLNTIQKELVPFRRDAWRALSWLKTEKNRFYYKILHVDGVKCNLLGSRGNYDGKRKVSASAKPFPKIFEPRIPRGRSCCKPIKLLKSWKLNLTVPEVAEPDIPPTRKLLDHDKQLLTLKPGPLSYKLQQLNTRLSTDECLGPIELVRLPPVELEVYPQLDRPLDASVIPYLRLMLPHEKITEEWAKFAVSLVKTDSDEGSKGGKFSFKIPFENNYDKLHVRRRLVTEFMARDNELLVDDLEKPLESTKVIADDDELGKEVAEVLTSLTNAVAIGLAEASFSKLDPDVDYEKEDKPLDVKEVTPVATSSKEPKKDKKFRVIRELKRLNATFITTDTKTSSCDQKFCERGCICDSLTSALSFKNHCKKLDCMLECNCSNNRCYVENSDIKDCNLSSDTVKCLREKATARLAKIEKDFTPTLLVSNDNTYLISNSDRKQTRRSKKLPKKFEDFNVTEGPLDSSPPPPRKIKFKNAYEAALHQMQHVNVTLRQLNNVISIEPWCMIHNLYKCFCRGEATDGKPFNFDDLDSVEERFDYSNRKRMYVFEREDGVDRKKPRFSLDSSDGSSIESTRLLPIQSPSQVSSRSLLRPLPSLEEDENTCQRVVPVDLKYTVKQDPEKIREMKVRVTEYEEKHPYHVELLKRRIETCEKRFYFDMKRTELPTQLIQVQEASSKDLEETPEIEQPPQKAKKVAKKPAEVTKTSMTLRKMTKEEIATMERYPIRLNIANSSEEVRSFSTLKPLVEEDKVLIVTGKNKIFAKKEFFYNGKMDFTNVIAKAKHQIFIIEKTEPEKANDSKTLKMLKTIRRARESTISEVVNIMMAPEGEDVKGFIENCNEELRNALVEAEPSSQCVEQTNLRRVNMMITRAMQYICDLQRKNTKHLIPPMISKLYFYRWQYMFQGFQQELLFVWEIKMEGDKEAVVVTLKNSPPVIDKLQSAVNIREFTADRDSPLSLFSRMLLLKVDGPATNNLALVLYGGTNFWRVCGFIKSEIDYCKQGIAARPTPSTHPELSLKINRFFNELYKKTTPERQRVEAGNVVAGGSEPKEKPQGPKKKGVLVIDPVNGTQAQYETNIKLFAANLDSLKSLFLPIPPIGEHRWFMLLLQADFSDIFIPEWNSYLTYDKISYALALAKKHDKTVRVTINEKFPEIYATPDHHNKIFFGPYRLDQDVNYILCQNFDGEIITREAYQERVKVVPRKATLGSWLYLKRLAAEKPELELRVQQTDNVLVKKANIVEVKKPLPLVISSVQTVTDPKLMPPTDDSDDDDVQEVPIQGKMDVIEILDDDDEEETPPKKEPETKTPIRLTLKKEGDQYLVNSSSLNAKSEPSKSAIITNLGGKKIQLPMSALKPLNQGGKNQLRLPANILKNISIVPNNGLKSFVLKPSPTSVSVKSTPSQAPSTSKSFVTKDSLLKSLSDSVKIIPTKDSGTVKPPLSISIMPVGEKKELDPLLLNKKPDLVVCKTSITKIPNPAPKTGSLTSSPEAMKQVAFGYFLTKFKKLGRIRAKRIVEENSEKYILKVKEKGKEKPSFKVFSFVGNVSMFLNQQLKPLTYACIPENIFVEWTFETRANLTDKYPDYNPDLMPKHLTITSFGVFDLAVGWNFGIKEPIDSYNYDRLLCLKLASVCFPNVSMLKSDVLSVLRTTQEAILHLKTSDVELTQTLGELEAEHERLKEKVLKLRLENKGMGLKEPERTLPSLSDSSSEFIKKLLDAKTKPPPIPKVKDAVEVVESLSDLKQENEKLKKKLLELKEAKCKEKQPENSSESIKKLLDTETKPPPAPKVLEAQPQTSKSNPFDVKIPKAITMKRVPMKRTFAEVVKADGSSATEEEETPAAKKSLLKKKQKPSSKETE